MYSHFSKGNSLQVHCRSCHVKAMHIFLRKIVRSRYTISFIQHCSYRSFFAQGTSSGLPFEEKKMDYTSSASLTIGPCFQFKVSIQSNG